MTNQNSITFAALGDSLTAGFNPYQPLGYGIPYTAILENMVTKQLADLEMNHIEVHFINLGINGETTLGMLGRFEFQVTSVDPDYVLIWGGINDLFGGIPPEGVMVNLRRLYQKVRRIGGIPVACTLTSVLGFDPAVTLVKRLNQHIREHCSMLEISLVDLFKATSDSEGRLLKEFSSDGVHLTKEGNERVASTIFEEAIIPILECMS